MMTDEDIARVTHGAILGYQDGINEMVISEPWYALPDWHKQSIIEGVRLAKNGATPPELHENWYERYESMGWSYGPKRDYLKKTHPCMLHWSDLPPKEQLKDIIFQAIVTVLVIHQDMTP